MKNKVAMVILVVACVALGIALYVVKQQDGKQHDHDVSSIMDSSNQLMDASQKLNDLTQANLALTNDLAASRQMTVEFSNNLTVVNNTLTNTIASLSGAQDQITNLNSQITDLETQNRTLDQRANELTNTIAQLNALIEDTQNKLALSQTNNVFLQEQLQKQIQEREVLEHKFNDLEVVRAQFRKLKDELYVARRMEIMKYRNTGNKKAGELLMERPPIQPVGAAAAAGVPPTNYDLNVEVGSDGSVKVIPPIGVTNAAPASSTAH
jgi:chromosome segregation ATPase